jgi:transposase
LVRGLLASNTVATQDRWQHRIGWAATAVAPPQPVAPTFRLSQLQSVLLAGLAPSEFRSGKSVYKHTRLSKAGSRHLRVHACVNGQAVYFPAVTAVRHNPLVKALYERLIASGKARMAAMGAAMRKVLMLAFGLLKARQPFDPNWASRLVQATT